MSPKLRLGDIIINIKKNTLYYTMTILKEKKHTYSAQNNTSNLKIKLRQLTNNITKNQLHKLHMHNLKINKSAFMANYILIHKSQK